MGKQFVVQKLMVNLLFTWLVLGLPKISRNEYREYLTGYLLKNYFDQDKKSLIEEIKTI